MKAKRQVRPSHGTSPLWDGLFRVSIAGRMARIAVTVCIVFWAASMATALADAIHFKDGSITVCRERAWEEKGKAWCEFYGTVVSYPMTDIDRIESGDAHLAPTPPMPEPPDAATPLPLSPLPPTESPSPPAPAPPPVAGASATPADGAGGSRFYDPRREKKFWASETSRHDTLDDALKALAEQYRRTPDWVRGRMGGSNSLPEIHRRLAAEGADAPATAAQSVPVPSIAPPDPESLKGLKFYDPRRPRKYWSSDVSRHDALGGALDALAGQYGQTVQWVKRHMGSTNDLRTIHDNLIRALGETGGQSGAASE